MADSITEANQTTLPISNLTHNLYLIVNVTIIHLVLINFTR